MSLFLSRLVVWKPVILTMKTARWGSLQGTTCLPLICYTEDTVLQLHRLIKVHVKTQNHFCLADQTSSLIKYLVSKIAQPKGVSDSVTAYQQPTPHKDPTQHWGNQYSIEVLCFYYLFCFQKQEFWSNHSPYVPLNSSGKQSQNWQLNVSGKTPFSWVNMWERALKDTVFWEGGIEEDTPPIPAVCKSH